MKKINPNPFNEPLTEQFEKKEDSVPAEKTKKQFIEPVVSVPVDVLETTSFFQSATTVDTADV